MLTGIHFILTYTCNFECDHCFLLVESELSYLNISNDSFHYGEASENPATFASSAARTLGIETSQICIEPPRVLPPSLIEEDKRHPVVGGGAKFRGRAVEKLSKNLPLRPWKELGVCPDEDIETPSRVHVDPYAHPICGPLLRGGPAELAKELGVVTETGYVDECHFCYLTRKEIIDKFPDFLTPRQVYG